MIKILLTCNAGMSTSIMVKKIQQEANARSIEAEVWAVPEVSLNEEWHKADVILLGPQVSFLEKEVKNITKGQIPVGVINMLHYGRMDGKAVLDQALKLLGE
ncbi:PTS sugar transporter subunit IIB [Ethanoligenens harbinense]|uniref:Phosphotransferase system lactose/cellobiose-specific IIB subunit n=1 Tax=Ethanoligenens harbinense (strain DSM 18485 / JCM 12961 / CGMCC 1.5033 / YUAN-3) TaxID=663278 RepID=E6U3B9_ETHHY|nr:PTS sugar transporter subunit IIB [Ethanoligenens harbinense]ADU26411.1 phosphotransferase system lactose/cellobiose-specific IIB subunit [Ethanoligenens harbinense YUAN-3]AVQ95535.1 PTS sugar transporter subunit IIB [Ethanoligenens harbinense YUAN-3]AYF38199.1 PTS sugar transporter subunit IIB [Ethanoligenens harbinense]AYF40944.1 PTS sugar transporter subunit IIB [Ethanoligenens harbinense]QCN91776.1 PTS sugar transporter subunit IIB [Ethanoligenens harbinense]